MNRTAAMKTAALFDVVVALIALPLLIVFSVLLESNMRGEWTSEIDARWNVLALGLCLLLVSLLVCCYVIHRLGICVWKAQNRRSLPSSTENSAQRAGTNGSTESQMNLVNKELPPPSYESLVLDSSPPSYFNILITTELEKSEQIATISASVKNDDLTVRSTQR